MSETGGENWPSKIRRLVTKKNVARVVTGAVVTTGAVLAGQQVDKPPVPAEGLTDANPPKVLPVSEADLPQIQAEQELRQNPVITEQNPEKAVPTAAPTEQPSPTATAIAKAPTAEPTKLPAEPTATPQPAVKETPAPTAELKLTAEDINFLAAHEISYGDRTKPNLALTFDAGASGVLWPRIKDILIKENVKITIFLTGDFINNYPDYIREMINMGIEIGNHSTKHPDFKTITKTDMQQEVIEFQRRLDKVANKHIPVRYFRFPYGSRDKTTIQVLAEMGLQSVYWSPDGYTGGAETDRNYQKVLDATLKATHKGNIVLMHVGSLEDVAALLKVLDKVRQDGLKIVPVSTAVADKDIPPSIKANGNTGSFALPGYSFQSETAPTPAKERKSYQISPTELFKGEAGRSEIALTFDIGVYNKDSINSILSTLKIKGVKVSVFVVGSFAKTHPEVIKALLDNGHEVLNHSYAHLDYAKTSSADMIKDAQQFESIMLEITGGKYVKKPYFRFPSVSSSLDAIKTMSSTGRLLINGSVVLRDWERTEDPNTQAPALLKRLLGATDGDVVIAHLNSPELPRILDEAINAWQSKGLKIVTVSTMFPLKPTNPPK